MGVQSASWEGEEVMALRPCRYDGRCCMRTEKNLCVALSDTHFKDGECHFQKRYRYGVNVYDAIKRARKRKEGVTG